MAIESSSNESSDKCKPALPTEISRRQVLQALAGMGVGSAVFQRALAAQVDDARQVTPQMIRQAEWIAGLELSDEEMATTARGLQRMLRTFESLRSVKLPNGVPPALHFHADPANRPVPQKEPKGVSFRANAKLDRPKSDDELAFLPLSKLSFLIRNREITSTELTKLYLDRLHRFDRVLHCVVTFTDDLALKQARRADEEIAAGRYRGPLHGMPWGAKDLIAYPGYKTTWGAPPFKDQVVEEKATVAQRLDDAGAVLVAKLSLGALAQGDRWFGGMTRNPWNPAQGSSGSSAGSAAATAAGLVGFALGSETLGSIVSPCRRCGVTGLRPTFGRISRHGCMALSWSMDKIGPIARSVEDCAHIFNGLIGPDGHDATVVQRPFHWSGTEDLHTFKVGYFESDRPPGQRAELKVLRDLGVQLVPIELPQNYPVNALQLILRTEAAAAFDELTRNGVTDGLNSWPETFRRGQFVPAVEYIRANRIRTLVMREMEKVMAGVNAYVGGNDLVITNLTGHPTVVMPNGLREQNAVKTPTSITFTGRLFGEGDLLALAHAYQQATGFHLEHPPIERLEG